MVRAPRFVPGASTQLNSRVILVAAISTVCHNPQPAEVK
ncbi:hypothetical protein GPUN_0406 [Glaciecola punicea ACAM 611]|uniref:Uncharacterized protein n=1 Tax=Glaciecola punicea ACAM 611 TaxID=1121923 RepID=H5T8B2_9ALTE|nr:hypothetical protein GPUN_0406 [Glaciecola punicea ACAM 611]